MNDQIWCFDGDLAAKSMTYVAEKAPQADAILANGMCNFRRASDGLANLRLSASKGPVCSKDFPHYVDHMWNEELLSQFNHSFLISNPAKTISSMFAKWPDFHEKEVGFIEQRHLFDKLCDRDGVAPPVVDSDDLLEDPAAVVKLWCQATGIAFIPEALRWEPGARDEVSWWDGGSFHANLRDSDGLKPQTRQYVEIDKLPDRVREIYDQVLPHYEHMHAHRLPGGL